LLCVSYGNTVAMSVASVKLAFDTSLKYL